MKKLAVFLGSFLLAGSLSAAQEDVVVASIKAVEGSVLVEDLVGNRTVANVGTKLTEGLNMIVLEKAKVELEYASSKCKIMHPANTLLQVSESAQCAPGSAIGVGQAAGAGASFNLGGIGAAGAGAGLGATAITTIAIGTLAIGAIAVGATGANDCTAVEGSASC